MAKKPSLKKAWVTKKVIRQLAEGLVPWDRKDIQRALSHLADQPGVVRSRERHGRVEVRAIDVTRIDGDLCLMEQLERHLSKKDMAIIDSCNLALVELFDPESITQAREEIQVAFTAVGINLEAPRDKIWFSSTVLENILTVLNVSVQKPQKIETFLENKLALLEALAGCDEQGAPAAITNLRTLRVVTETWLNVQDVVTLGQDEAALSWLRMRCKPNFGPKSILLMQDVARALVEVYPTDPRPIKAKKTKVKR